MTDYYRPLVQHGTARPAGAVMLAGGSLWFTHAERLTRTGPAGIVPVSGVAPLWLDRLSAPRAPVAGLDLGQPRIMGILNVTPDSFSDGGLHDTEETAVAGAVDMAERGADILDIGGESTRPGAGFVPADVETIRTVPVINRIKQETILPVSIDTRKSAVAAAALAAGADLVNDVSGFTHDPALGPLCAANTVPVCVMHAQGDPETMQKNPTYENVVLDVFDFLDRQITALIKAGIPRSHIVADPGIGFGKTLDHNLAILRNLSLFHGLGCAILLGASRKRFIGTLANEPDAAARAPGSIAVGLAALGQGVQILGCMTWQKRCRRFDCGRRCVQAEPKEGCL